jgi:hypothetical protein
MAFAEWSQYHRYLRSERIATTMNITKFHLLKTILPLIVLSLGCLSVASWSQKKQEPLDNKSVPKKQVGSDKTQSARKVSAPSGDAALAAKGWKLKSLSYGPAAFAKDADVEAIDAAWNENLYGLILEIERRADADSGTLRPNDVMLDSKAGNGFPPCALLVCYADTKGSGLVRGVLIKKSITIGATEISPKVYGGIRPESAISLILGVVDAGSVARYSFGERSKWPGFPDIYTSTFRQKYVLPLGNDYSVRAGSVVDVSWGEINPLTQSPGLPVVTYSGREENFESNDAGPFVALAVDAPPEQSSLFILPAGARLKVALLFHAPSPVPKRFRFLEQSIPLK